MRIVIDIPDEIYNEYMIHTDNYVDSVFFGTKEKIVRAIRNSTPLPKGYGRLIDAKALEDAMYHEAFEVDSDMQKWDSGNWIRYKMFENAIRDAKTIVEADKEI